MIMGLRVEGNRQLMQGHVCHFKDFGFTLSKMGNPLKKTEQRNNQI